MVEQFAKHSLIDVTMKVDGDLHVDQHHTTEDSAIALGQAISDALGDKGGIVRFGEAFSPMDETLARVALDITSDVFEALGARATSSRYGLDRFWRNVRVHTLHDSLDLKQRDIGRWLLSGEQPAASLYS